MKKEAVKYDCRDFEGHIPCKPNKLYDMQCDDCSHYDASESAITILYTKKSLLQEIFKICNFTKQDKVEEILKTQTQETRILFIKLGAIGDVIRTTPLLERYKKEYGNCHFSWITHSPQVVPKDEVDVIYKWDASSVSVVALTNNHIPFTCGAEAYALETVITEPDIVDIVCVSKVPSVSITDN